jgi:exodeoxyribonuclease V alpha subunit
MTPNQMIAAIPERRPATEEISGLIERVTFHNDESGFCVLRVKTPGRRDEKTVIGSSPSVTAGECGAPRAGGSGTRSMGCNSRRRALKTVPPTTPSR